jgi:hypothetical protein
MNNSIDTNKLKLFIVQNYGTKIAEGQTQKLGIDANKFEEANLDENNYLELDEIIGDNDLCAQFATLYVEEQDKKQATKDKEQEKEEQMQVKDKNQAGV